MLLISGGIATPAKRREVVKHLVGQNKISKRRACQLMSVGPSSLRYQRRQGRDAALRARLQALATESSRYGYLLLHGLLKREGLVITKKRTCQIYREEGLQVRTKKRKKLQRPWLPTEVPTKPNSGWSMDFVPDQPSNGRRFRILNVVDDFSRELVGQLVSFSISGHQVARFLNQLAETRGLPAVITVDDGTEFTSKAMHFWSQDTGVALGFI